MHKSVALSAFLVAACFAAPLALAAPPAADPAPPASAGATGSAHEWHSTHGWQHGQRWSHGGYWQGHRNWHRRGAFRALRGLDLTDAQRKDIHQFTRASFQTSAPEWKALREKRAAFERATPGTPEYVAASNDLAHAEGDAALAAVLRRSALRTKIYGVLTPAQRTQLAANQAKWRSHMEAWRKARAGASS